MAPLSARHGLQGHGVPRSVGDTAEARLFPARLGKACPTRGVEFRIPADHPRVSLPAARAFYWIEERQPEMAPAFARRVFELYYGDGLDTASAETVAALAPEFGFGKDEMLLGLADSDLKDRVKRIGEEAVERGVFGSPFFIVDDEPFWGWDRMAMLEDWIRRGGW